MKKPFNPAIPDYTPRAKKPKEEEVKLDLKPCLNCGKAIGEGYYGSFEGGGVCSKACNTAQELKPKYPPPSEAFLALVEAQDEMMEWSVTQGETHA